MPGEPMRFPARQVERHAGSVDQVAGAVRTARTAVHDVTMDTGAYGMLCQFLPGILSPVFGAGADALGRTADSLHETATKLRATARETLNTDEASRRLITRAGTGGRPALDLPL